jgi:TonB-dependent starch-binding outer membrane protein SusC
MLLDIAVPGYVGNDGPIGNVAKMNNTGVELELGYTKKIGQVNLSISGNISHIANEVTYLGLDKKFLPGQTYGPSARTITRTSVGESFGYFYGLKTNGIFQNQAEVTNYKSADGTTIQPEAKPGDFKYTDINGDGKINDDDRTKIGNAFPNFTYGFNIAASYKAFDVLLFGQGISGNQIYNATRRFDLPLANMTSDALNRWTGEGTSTTYPRLVRNDPNGNFSKPSNFFIEDGSFFRIRTLQLGFTLPKSMTQSVGIKKCRLYVSANNLLTITQYKGFDPEIGGGSYGVDRGVYPQARSFMFGGNVTF